MLKRRKCVFFSFLLSSYKSNLRILLQEESEHDDDISEPQHLQGRISKIFGTQIKIVFMHNKNVVCPVDVIVVETTYLSLKKTDSIRVTALGIGT